eukprot:861121-Pelagomonas_calceolata.AAC.7
MDSKEKMFLYPLPTTYCPSCAGNALSALQKKHKCAHQNAAVPTANIDVHHRDCGYIGFPTKTQQHANHNIALNADVPVSVDRAPLYPSASLSMLQSTDACAPGPCASLDPSPFSFCVAWHKCLRASTTHPFILLPL